MTIFDKPSRRGRIRIWLLDALGIIMLFAFLYGAWWLFAGLGFGEVRPWQ